MGQGTLSERRDFRSLFDQLDGVALWTATKPGEFDYISDGFEDIWGIPADTVEDDVEKLLETVHPDDRERVRENIEASARELRDHQYENRIIRPDGSVRWVLIRQTLLRDDAGDVSEVVGIATDITEQKHREQELEILNRIVRHDIRNDMAVVLGWGEYLESYVDEEGMEYLEKMLASSENVVELTEAARDYVETVVGDAPAQLEPVALCSVLETELTLREEAYPHADFRVPESIPDVEVRADKMVGSVFRNLLNNAVQHNDNDTPIVEVDCVVDSDTVQVRIADNGPGIPDDQKDVVFGKGEQRLGSAGTGIGLYLVRTLVDQYDGAVWVEDNEATGSVFVVEFPRVS